MEKCEECGADIRDFEECAHSSGSIRSAVNAASRPFLKKSINYEFDGFEVESNKSILPYLLSPFGAIALDYVFPLWSSVLISVGLVVASFMIINTAANIFYSHVNVGLKVLLLSFVRSINAPRAIFLRSNKGKSIGNIAIWIMSLVAATILVFSNVTIMNANSLERRLTADGLAATGQEFTIDCPTGFTSGFPGNEIVCRAEVIFGLTVPVTVQINGPFEEITWKAGW